MSLLLPLAGAVAGVIVGSFIATLCVRWPRGEQVISGRSRCDSCGRQLSGRELIPIASWFAASGRCRSCGAPIAKLHLAIELAAAALAALALALQPGAGGVALALFWLLLLAPAVLDARHYWLPDKLTAVLGVAGLLFSGFATGVPLTDRLVGGAAGFAALWLIRYAYRRMRGREGLGAGDPKFLGAIGLWTGWLALPAILLVAALAGLGLALAQGRTRLDRMPFGSLLALGAFLWTAAVAAGV